MLLDESRSYHSTRRKFSKHLREVHHVPSRDVPGFLRVMLGDLYREGMEYEIGELPVWPEEIMVDLDSDE